MKLLNYLRQQLEAKKVEAKDLALNENSTLEDIQAKQKEIKDLKARIESLEEIEKEEKEEVENKIKNNKGTVIGKDGDIENSEAEYEEVFLKAFRGKELTAAEKQLLETKAALSSTTGEDGGYTIPVDQQTRIKELKRSLPALENYVKIEPVNTLTGSRNIEKNALYTPFAEFTEVSGMANTDSPQFTNISYSIKDRGGILPVPNNLLNDTNTNLRSYLDKWLAKKSVATRNNLIVTLLNTLSKVVVDEFDDIKSIMNVTLDPAISMGCKVFTNQSGFNWLDTLKDNDNRYLLTTDPVDASKKRINGKEVVVFSDKALPNRNDGLNYQAPIIIGDLEEAVVLFDRQQMSLLATNVGGDAFKYNRTDIRAIEREDVKMFDSEAVVFGEINVGTV
ncbi:phage major capsid protein [Wukongibacter sp. M2B1]|uniref:phage major capsid protein n=1 Tax=Wukongibacter sp. M2B1 TaxID=3088895 RepID=UPI003D7998F2